jgi:Tfp pilus assembly protein PilO
MNRRLLIPIGVGVVLVLLWFVALWSPQGSALSDARKKASDAMQQGATLRDQLKRLQDSRRDQPLKQSRLETLRVAIPDDPSLAQFILDANDAASIAGIDFLSVTPTPPSAQGQATTPTTVAGAAGGAAGAPVPIRIAMTISGGYFQVLDFMNRLNGLPRLVVIDSVTMTAQAAATQLQVTLQERIFTTSSRPVAGATTPAGGGGAPGSSTTTTAPGAATTTTRTGGG